MAWEDAWREGRTGWDAGGSPPELRRQVSSASQRYPRVLVPGCGTGYDLVTLASIGDRVIGLDLAPTAHAHFSEQADVPPGSSIEHLTADFFQWQPGKAFNLIWDYTFLCAIDPGMRQDWAARMAELCVPNAELWTLIFPVVDKGPNPGGPPYPMSPQLVENLLGTNFQRLDLHPVKHSHPGRQGKEWFARWQRC